MGFCDLEYLFKVIQFKTEKMRKFNLKRKNAMCSE